MASPVPPELSRTFLTHHLRLLLINAKIVVLTQGHAPIVGVPGLGNTLEPLEGAEVGVQEMRIYTLPNPAHYSDTQAPPPHPRAMSLPVCLLENHR